MILMNLFPTFVLHVGLNHMVLLFPLPFCAVCCVYACCWESTIYFINFLSFVKDGFIGRLFWKLAVNWLRNLLEYWWWVVGKPVYMQWILVGFYVWFTCTFLWLNVISRKSTSFSSVFISCSNHILFKFLWLFFFLDLAVIFCYTYFMKELKLKNSAYIYIYIIKRTYLYP